MSRYVTDTHALYWHLTNDTRLSSAARQVFEETDTGIHQILVPGIVLIEMVYLVEKGRLDRDLVDQVLTLLDTVGGSYTVAPLDQDTARALYNISRSAVPDMPDRIIAATAHQLGLPVITRDAKIHKGGVVTVIW
ncbi:MAG: type II toxin-antitoxin system VapC family toxin [Anaerolineae bacterium]